MAKGSSKTSLLLLFIELQALESGKADPDPFNKKKDPDSTDAVKVCIRVGATEGGTGGAWVPL